MNKKDRQNIFDKFGGRCAYCGCELPDNWKAINVYRVYMAIGNEGGIFTQNDTIENKNPSCIGCFRRRIECAKDYGESNPSDEAFRNYLIHSFDFLKSNPYYENAIKYGQITETGIGIKFHFEKQISN